jgi:hypothetical protein
VSLGWISRGSNADLGRREKSVRALLFRHPDLSADDEVYLTEKLQIKTEWLHEAKVSFVF